MMSHVLWSLQSVATSSSIPCGQTAPVGLPEEQKRPYITSNFLGACDAQEKLYVSHLTVLWLKVSIVKKMDPRAANIFVRSELILDRFMEIIYKTRHMVCYYDGIVLVYR